jgi:AcrR family transcriptional regulator
MDAKRPYHHGDLRNALLDAARAILEEESLAALSLRAVARRAQVSHAAPYRHFPNHEALLVELAVEGFAELRAEIATAAAAPGEESDRIAHLGAAYMRFVARRPALTRLMYGPQVPNRVAFPALGRAADAIGEEVLEDVVDLGQRRSGLAVLPSRAEILLRSLFSVRRD